jgi:hypothetical protein
MLRPRSHSASRPGWRAGAWRAILAGLLAASFLSGASAQTEGGLYVAGDGFSFKVAAERAMAQNRGGSRFFLLVLPPETAALVATASDPSARLRGQVMAANGVLLVCQRDIDAGRMNAADLVPGVVAVRGWPPKGSDALPAGQRHYADEDPSKLPSADEALRRLRSACS